jgi:hypothetical protein
MNWGPEKLWLACVMWVKFKKEWGEGEWEEMDKQEEKSMTQPEVSGVALRSPAGKAHPFRGGRRPQFPAR